MNTNCLEYKGPITHLLIELNQDTHIHKASSWQRNECKQFMLNITFPNPGASTQSDKFASIGWCDKAKKNACRKQRAIRVINKPPSSK